jgi:hypothetical protein
MAADVNSYAMTLSTFTLKKQSLAHMPFLEEMTLNVVSAESQNDIDDCFGSGRIKLAPSPLHRLPQTLVSFLCIYE